MSKLPRPSSPQQRQSLKFYVRAALNAVRANAFAMVTRGEAGSLSRYGGDNYPDAHMPIDVLADLEMEHMAKLGAPSPVLVGLAAMIGMKLVPLESGDEATLGYHDLAELAGGKNDVLSTLAEAMSDGKIDHAERVDVGQRIAAEITMLHRIGRKVAAAGGGQ